MADYQTIEVNPIGAHLGAEVVGANLAEPLGDQVFQEIHDALIEHQVIFFRDQQMTLDQHKNFGRRFGPLHAHTAAAVHDGDPEVVVIHADAESRRAPGEVWHTDMSPDKEPPMGSILHLHQAPPIGGDTLFASMYAAYEGLSKPVQNFIGGLQAWHDSEHYHRRHAGNEHLRPEDYPRSLHPVVRTHPVSGRNALYVNRAFTTHIDGLTRTESDGILQMLYQQAEKPEFQSRFVWRNNSVAFWDNRCVQHRAIWDYYPQVRHGCRVTVTGDRPF